jgi:hypothetical protein
MIIKYHKGFGHGLRPGTTHDMNCTACIAELKSEANGRCKMKGPHNGHGQCPGIDFPERSTA